jgi:hypothetical protein
MSNGPAQNAPTVQNPLTLLMPVKQEMVSTLAVQLIPLQAALTEGLNQIGIVHFVRVLFLPGTNTLAIITSYDGDFDAYILAFVRNPIVAQVFDTFLTFIDDDMAQKSLPVQQNSQTFLTLLNYYDATSTQRAGTFAFYSAYPKVTVKQIVQAFPPSG